LASAAESPYERNTSREMHRELAHSICRPLDKNDSSWQLTKQCFKDRLPSKVL